MISFATDWTDPVIAAEYQAARAETIKLAEGLRLAVETKDTVSIEDETFRLLTDPAPKDFFALRVERSGKVGRVSPGRCLKQACKLDLLSPCDEKAAVILREKLNGKHRLILNFGLRYRTAQNIIRLVLSAHHRPRPFQFTHLGVPIAIKRVIELIDQGNIWCAHLDIKKLYPSFRIEKLREDAALGGLLPSKTVAAFVHARGLEMSVRAEQLKHFPSLS